MISCINLRERFGDRYRLALEPPAKSWADPWSHLILCQHGHIHPHGGDLLGFASDKAGSVARKVEALPFTTVVQSGSDGMNIVFPAEFFDEVAVIARPKRRRRVTDQERQRLTDMGRRFHFKHGVQNDSGAPERTQMPFDDPEDQNAIGTRFGTAEPALPEREVQP